MFGLALRVVTWDPRALSSNFIYHRTNPRGPTQPVIPSRLAKMNISTLVIGAPHQQHSHAPTSDATNSQKAVHTTNI